MIAFAATVASPGVFARCALRGLRRVAEADSPVAECTDARSAAAAYNEVLDAFRDHEGLEALVLLDEATELLDPGFCANVRRRLAEDRELGALLDGRVLVLSPWAVRELRFDEARGGACAEDLRAQAAAAGRRVLDAPLRIVDHRAPASAPAGEGPPEHYYELARPELADLVPASARRILDVGCGGGALGAALKARQGAEVAGIEFVAEAAARARRRLDHVVQGDLDAIEGLAFPAGHFDAMVFGDVLEHLRDPARLLRALLPHLAPGGRVVCSIPNVKHWTVVLPLLFEDRFEYTDAGLLDRTHLHLFTRHEIEAMLAACGLEVEHLGANRMPLPDTLADLARRVLAAAKDPAEQLVRLQVYQYLVVARRA
jgi:2-polyprenyl-3-methyl-5-hydroxy-6-metoxy-1,4-benzoquinol methylase